MATRTTDLLSTERSSSMSDLIRHRKTLQALSELIKYSLGVDVFFVDTDMVAVAGTGPYRVNVGTRRPRDSYVDVTIHQGEGQVVTEPKYTKQCYRCDYRPLCPYSMVMCHPIISDSQVKGLMGFLGFSKEQRGSMIERSSFLSELCRRLGYIWDHNWPDIGQFFSHPMTKVFVDAFEEGIVLMSPDCSVLTVNQKGEYLLGANGGRGPRANPLCQAAGARLSRVDPLSLGAVESAQSLMRAAYPISDGQTLAGRMIVLEAPERSRKAAKNCPLVPCRSSMIVGASPAIVRVKERAAYVAESDSTVLILGETGVGKEVLARFIHQASRRWEKPFEAVNCAAVPDALFESELFGYAPGAFTGARKSGKAGRFLMAHGGTIFLDEIGRLSLDNQAKILRILDEGELQRLGRDEKETVDVRVLAATNINLEKAVQENRFLGDLYYRLAVIPLYVPPLRERIEDVPLLIEHFITKLMRVLPASEFQGFSGEALGYLLAYEWPGNVRELKNAVEYVMNIVRGRKVGLHDLPPTIRHRPMTQPQAGRNRAAILPLAEVEKHQIQAALETFGETTEGKRRAARLLGISLSTLYRKISARNKSQ
jgi:DNA-binding NtrC family response regulator